MLAKRPAARISAATSKIKLYSTSALSIYLPIVFVSLIECLPKESHSTPLPPNHDYGKWFDPQHRRLFVEKAIAKFGTMYLSKEQIQGLQGTSPTLLCLLWISKPFVIGSRIRTLYPGHVTALAVELPEHAVHAWKFNPTTRGWWAELARLYRNGDNISKVVVELVLEDIIMRSGEKPSRAELTDTDRFRLSHFGKDFDQLYSEIIMKPSEDALRVSRDKPQPIFKSPVPSSHWQVPKNRFEFLEKLKLLRGNLRSALYQTTMFDFTYNGGKHSFTFVKHFQSWLGIWPQLMATWHSFQAHPRRLCWLTLITSGGHGCSISHRTTFGMELPLVSLQKEISSPKPS